MQLEKSHDNGNGVWGEQNVSPTPTMVASSGATWSIITTVARHCHESIIMLLEVAQVKYIRGPSGDERLMQSFHLMKKKNQAGE